MKNVIIWSMVLVLSLLTACSGSDSSDGSRFVKDKEAEETDPEVTDPENGSLTNVSFIPLMTIERHKEWFDDENSNVFLTYHKMPLINYYSINPVNASTLEPITTARASDFTITEDEVAINPKVSFPLLQRVLGNTIILSTALVINTSTSMDGVDKTALIEEIKSYVSNAKNSGTSYIANQAFTVWGYDGVAVEETGGFKTDILSIHAALDTVLAKWKTSAYSLNTGSNYTYDAVVEAIGRYVGDGAYSITAGEIEFRDSITGDNNDLRDYITPDITNATSLVLFSAGDGSPNRFNPELAINALESQSTLVYEEGVPVAGSATETKSYPKTFMYIVPDGEPQDGALSQNATKVILNSISGGKYSFASEILSAQKSDIDQKTIVDNQHVLRWASAFREGKGHTRSVKTRTAQDKYGYALSVDEIEMDPALALGMPKPQVEITGANNEYLAAGVLSSSYDTAITYADEITRFYPATRWTNQVFTNANYTWSSVPASAFTLNSDGSVTVNANLLPVELKLTNSNINYEGGTITDDFTLTIKVSK